MSNLLVPCTLETVPYVPPAPPPEPTRRQWATIAQVMDHAAALLDHGRRWHQGTYKVLIYPGKIVYCLVGAVGEAAEDIALDWDPRRAPLALWALCETLGLDHSGLTTIESWNDQPGRTAEEVLAALRATAERARAKAAPLPTAETRRITRRLVARWEATRDLVDLTTGPVALDVIAAEEAARRKELTPA